MVCFCFELVLKVSAWKLEIIHQFLCSSTCPALLCVVILLDAALEVSLGSLKDSYFAKTSTVSAAALNQQCTTRACWGKINRGCWEGRKDWEETWISDLLLYIIDLWKMHERETTKATLTKMCSAVEGTLTSAHADGTSAVSGDELNELTERRLLEGRKCMCHTGCAELLRSHVSYKTCHLHKEGHSWTEAFKIAWVNL